MGQTNELSLPWPEASDLADGPDALQDLAQATEAKMTQLRLWTADRYTPNNSDQGQVVNAGVTYTFMTPRTVPLTAIGWAEIEITAAIFQADGYDPANWAGYVQIFANDALSGQFRFHSHGIVRGTLAVAKAIVALPKSATGLIVKATISSDPNSSVPFRIIEVDANFRQYGAPRT